MENNSKAKAWIIDANMGYGHQRASYPLRGLAPNKKVIHANDYPDIPKKAKKMWESSRGFYEFISRFKRIPLVGRLAFKIFDYFQRIKNYYPKRNLSNPIFLLKQNYYLIKKGLGKHLIDKLKINPLPIVSTFFTSAFVAENFDYPNDIYCVICDADIARSWAPLNPEQSRIKYFCPNTWTVNRLKLYGVKEKNIFLTGFPLPLENIGTEKLEILKQDMKNRLVNLDPKKNYLKKYKVLVDKHLGPLPEKSNHPLTLMFAVGGAGAQKELGMEIIKSLKELIQQGKIRMALSLGVREEVKDYFVSELKKSGIKGVKIIFNPEIEKYFEEFNLFLRETDILWTKPSELSFYSGLGLPIIIATTIGSQEDFNRKWLISMGAGVLQENSAHTGQWLFDFLDSGRLAEASMQGFIEVEKLGVLKIREIVS
ncbi:hypothetical protein KKC63_01020 [Patescibacteria group bacterium]|nr:hypothetical protein [Patescibacteria group bacterium]MBU4022938.1 hypothetical protein [Patescibacteria group bacterium]MBU4078288.1 hypothetical protein [Patescibacteria group bacterium]